VQVGVFDLLCTVHRPGSSDAKSLPHALEFRFSRAKPWLRCRELLLDSSHLPYRGRGDAETDLPRAHDTVGGCRMLVAGAATRTSRRAQRGRSSPARPLGAAGAREGTLVAGASTRLPRDLFTQIEDGL
jgi:hypothetical protein